MPSTKGLITGIVTEAPIRLNDFTNADQGTLMLLLEKLKVGLQQAAKLLLLQIDAPELRVVLETNPNLFVLSAMYFGDVTKWRDIAGVSQLSLAVLEGDHVIKIPQSVSTAGLSTNSVGGGRV